MTEPDRLVSVFASHLGGSRHDIVSFPDYLDLKERSAAFSGLAAHYPFGVSLRQGSGARVVMGQTVSWNFLDVLGVRPALGRTFRPEEDRTEPARPVAILSYRVWTEHFGSDLEILGRTVFYDPTVGPTTEADLQNLYSPVRFRAPPPTLQSVTGVEAPVHSPLPCR